VIFRINKRISDTSGRIYAGALGGGELPPDSGAEG
jgi:hypothetical protein